MSQPIDSVEQAQEREQEQNALTPEQVLETVHSIDLLNPKLYIKLQQMKSQLVPYLKQAMRERQGFTCLNAGRLLLYLGEAEGTEAFITGLQHPDDPNLPRYVLVDLMTMKLDARPQPFDLYAHIHPLPLRREEVFFAVVPYLQNSEADLRKFAVEVLANLDLPQTEAAVLPLLKDHDRTVRLAVVRWFANHNLDRGALKVAEELLLSGEQSSGEGSVIDSLEKYIDGGNPVLSQQAVDLLERYVLNTIRSPLKSADRATSPIDQGYVANELDSALEAFAKANSPQEKQLLMLVLDSTAEDWVRGSALERLSQLDREAALPKLQAALSDRALGEYAAKILANLARNQPDTLASINHAALIKTVEARLNDEQNWEAMARFLDALIALDGDVKAIAPSAIERLDSFGKMRVVWATKGLTHKQLAARLIQAGIINPLSDQEWQEIEQSWQERENAAGIVVDLLSTSNRITFFDAETVIPVDYRKLIEDLMQISHGSFQISALSQFEQQGRFSLGEQVQFVYRNQVYRFKPKEMGDWYDVDATLEALNRTLQEHGHSERFIALEPDGQFAIVVFAPDSAFREIAREFAIPLAQSSQASP